MTSREIRTFSDALYGKYGFMHCASNYIFSLYHKEIQVHPCGNTNRFRIGEVNIIDSLDSPFLSKLSSNAITTKITNHYLHSYTHIITECKLTSQYVDDSKERWSVNRYFHKVKCAFTHLSFTMFSNN